MYISNYCNQMQMFSAYAYYLKKPKLIYFQIHKSVCQVREHVIQQLWAFPKSCIYVFMKKAPTGNTSYKIFDLEMLFFF